MKIDKVLAEIYSYIELLFYGGRIILVLLFFIYFLLLLIIFQSLLHDAVGHCFQSRVISIRLFLYPFDLKRIERMDLLIQDDFCMQAFDSQSRGILMDIIKDRHQKKSTMITSQLSVKGWYDAIGEKTVADAILDRLVPNALRVELYGESIRKRKIKKEDSYL